MWGKVSKYASLSLETLPAARKAESRAGKAENCAKTTAHVWRVHWGELQC